MSEPTLQDCINYMRSQIKQMEKHPRSYEFNLPYYRKTVELLEKAQRPHGEWEKVDKWVDGKYVGGFIHKECPMIKISDDCLYSPWTYNFCPNCGADMRQKEGGEK